jgi:hypothetical protein
MKPLGEVLDKWFGLVKISCGGVLGSGFAGVLEL